MICLPLSDLTLVHIVPGLLFMVLGPIAIQFNHSGAPSPMAPLSGRIFVICGVVIGISALVMSFGMPAIGGLNQAAATTLFATFFLFALCKAFWHIRGVKSRCHREWMIRGFRLGLRWLPSRPIIGMFFATSRFSGLTPYQFFGTAFWIGLCCTSSRRRLGFMRRCRGRLRLAFLE